MKLGFNYLPPSLGCGSWRAMQIEEVERDFASMAGAGAELVRCFVFWADFEPRPGQYEDVLLNRLRDFTEAAGRHGLQCVISILTVWMNGQVFDLPWRNGHDLWTDANLQESAARFAGVVAGALRGSRHVAGIDIGDEILEAPVGRAAAVTQHQAKGWYAAIAGAIRTALPGVPVFQANQGHFLWARHGFHPRMAGELDGLMIHGFPSWTPFAIESSGSYKGRLYPSFLAALAKAFSSTVLVDEFGCYGVSEAVLESYFRTSGASVLGQWPGALLFWCWRDLSVEEKPYDLRPEERLAGMVREDGSGKPVLRAWRRLVELRDRLGACRPESPEVAILVPELGTRDVVHGYLAGAEPSIEAIFLAYMLAKRAHLRVSFTLRAAGSHRLLIVPCCARLTADLSAELYTYANQGGHILYTPGNYQEAAGNPKLFGVRLRDFTLLPDELAAFAWRTEEYPIYSSLDRHNRRKLPIVEPDGGTVVSVFRDGSPALLERKIGRGGTLYCNCPFEELVALPGCLAARRWERFYREVASWAGLAALPVQAPADVELVTFDGPAGGSERAFLAINHSAHTVNLETSSAGGITLRAHDFAVWFEPVKHEPEISR